MTRNLYLGADIERVVAAVGDPVAVGRAMLDLRATVAATDFSVRARLIAAEVAATVPDVIGLQEAALWRERIGEAGDEVVTWDFLDSLLAELSRAGCAYVVAVATDRADLAVPIPQGVAEAGAGANPEAKAPVEVRLTMRDVLLVREGVAIGETAAGRYEANLSFEVAGLTLAPERGWQWVEVGVGERPVRVVNTHLESLGADLTLAQAEELHRALPTDKAVVVLGDFNSDPLDGQVREGAEAAPNAAYLAMLVAGFVDAWDVWAADGWAAESEPGWTACLGEYLDDPAGAGFDHRLDFVFVRGGQGARLAVSAVVLTGATPDTRDPVTGLWASDHAGVVVELASPPA